MATIGLPSGFQIQPQDPALDPQPSETGPNTSPVPAPAPPPVSPPPLGVLTNFSGTFAGAGFNAIFRPNNNKTAAFPNPVSGVPNPPAEQTLELNLTTETLSFTSPLGSVPNRGLAGQPDIFLNGVTYLQVIQNNTDPNEPISQRGIHVEPGLWMHVPSTSNDPNVPESLVRMASIPHGTTINAQGLEPTSSIAGPPTFKNVDLTPFPIGQPSNRLTGVFPSLTAANTDTPRLPQDLTSFINAGTITQAILDNPNLVLQNANAGLTITKTITIVVSTTPTAPELGGGTANIGFLAGAPASTNSSGQPTGGPNALAAAMTAVFWIETVQTKITVPAHKTTDPPLKPIPAPSPHPGAVVPSFQVTPPHDITSPTTITVNYTQIQYSQNVDLNFATLTWPHVSVATLVPQAPVPVPASAFNC